MKRSARARNRIRRQSTVGVSLFPFLAVLICTMGALILLLVVIARQARLQAAEDTANKNAEIREKVTDQREWAQWEIREFEQSRRKTESQLAEARLALGHVEDHARRLREQLRRLEAASRGLQGLDREDGRRRAELEAELGRLRDQIAGAQRELTEAWQKAAKRRQSYAIVPYQGPHGTRRRPIYVECRRNAVIVQPEGIVLTADDFAGPMGPGNPLDVALRAAREHLLRQKQFDAEEGEPYPLLLIRPSGIAAYYAARSAMGSWGSEFGYELIEEDWELDFQPPDSVLAEQMQQAVATARARQQRLIAAAPRRYAASSPEGFVAAPYRGGLIPENGSDDDRLGFQRQRPSGRFGSRFEPEGDGRPGQSSAPKRATVGQPGEQGEQGDSTYAPGGREEEPGEASAESFRSGPSGQEASGWSLAADRPKSLAISRGRNWGLPNTSGGSVPITSPIRIDCYPDRLVLVPEKGLGRPQVIALGPRTEDGVDELVAAVWQYTDLWGSAGRGMYWSPVLNVHVAPGAANRYVDLKILLEGSGLDVRRNDEREMTIATE